MINNAFTFPKNERVTLCQAWLDAADLAGDGTIERVENLNEANTIADEQILHTDTALCNLRKEYEFKRLEDIDKSDLYSAGVKAIKEIENLMWCRAAFDEEKTDPSLFAIHLKYRDSSEGLI